jgi:hypothetical protein
MKIPNSKTQFLPDERKVRRQDAEFMNWREKRWRKPLFAGEMKRMYLSYTRALFGQRNFMFWYSSRLMLLSLYISLFTAQA